ncbi:MAG: ABC transporter ATP-binding protein/permease [Clostridium sp.]
MMINKRLINLCDDSKKYIGLTVLVNWISIICNILIVLFIGQFINKIYLGEKLVVNSAENIITALNNFEIVRGISLLTAMIIIIILLGIRYYCNYLYGKFSYLASANARVKLRELIYAKLLKLGMNYNDKVSTSSVVQVTVEGVEALEVYFGKYLPQFFYAMLAPITLFVFISFISFKTAIVFMLCVPLIPMSIIAIMKIAKKILKEYWGNYANLGDVFLDNLQGLTTLKVFNRDKDKHEKMNVQAEKFRVVTMKVLSMQLNSINVMDLIAFGGAALGTIIALVQFKNGEVQIGSLLIIILLSSEFFIPLRLLGSFFHIAMNGMAASDIIFKLLDMEERTGTNEEKVDNVNKEVTVKLELVDFSYDSERKVLENINMEITSGGLVAIVGESGSGKSTIASLILNKYEVTSGCVTVNEKNINEISIDKLYEKISLISTNSYILNGTILDNLLLANNRATEDEIENALKVARLYEFVKESKDGLKTNVGEGGNSLSGGQRQRLALARAILANREMIVFDEATSNIDVESEEDIWEAIYELSKEKTILVISHRLANVKDAKTIYVMNQGKIVEEGTHEELLTNKNEYFKMINKQRELENIREVL